MAKQSAKDKIEGGKSIQNRKARYDYELLDKFEAGIVLAGSEVKSIWLGRVNMADSYCEMRSGELWIVNLDVEVYEHTSRFQHERRRARKLLLHRKEIDLIDRKSMEKGFTIVPTALYFKNGKCKAEVCLARGKREYDKRSQIAKDETRREMDRVRKERF